MTATVSTHKMNYFLKNIPPICISVRQKFLKQFYCTYFSFIIIGHLLHDKTTELTPCHLDVIETFVLYLACDTILLVYFKLTKDKMIFVHHFITLFYVYYCVVTYNVLRSYYYIGIFELFSIFSGVEKYLKTQQSPNVNWIRAYKLFIVACIRIPILIIDYYMYRQGKFVTLLFLMYDSYIARKLIRTLFSTRDTPKLQ